MRGALLAQGLMLKQLAIEMTFRVRVKCHTAVLRYCDTNLTAILTRFRFQIMSSAYHADASRKALTRQARQLHRYG